MTLPAALILSGGLGLGAYQLGAFAELMASGAIDIPQIAGASIGAMNAAIIAGNPPEARVERLGAFWEAVTTDAAPSAWLDPLEWSGLGSMRQGRNWTSALGGRVAGIPNLFRPRAPVAGDQPVASLYDKAPARDTLARFIDFDRLNDGGMRVCIATTDVETGAGVLFDTAAGDRIGLDHILASGGLMPAFAPIRIGGRLLGDGGFAANATLDPFVASDRPGSVPRLCILLDLFAGDVAMTGSLESAAERSTDLQFASQTVMAIERLIRERALEARLPDRRDDAGTDLLYLSYQPARSEAGPEKSFDFSRATLTDRAQAGADDARAALAMLPALTAGAPGLRVHKVRR